MTAPTAILTLLLALAPFCSSPAQAPGPEKKAAKSSTLFPQFKKHLVIIRGDIGTGSGSIIMMGGKPLVITNAHMLSGQSQISFSQIDGTQIKVEKLASARGADLAAYSQSGVTEGLELLNEVDKNVNIGDEVVVLGNSKGADVVTEIMGKVVGIGPEKVEVDAKFVEGNSGSPIIHVKTGKVIGIATQSLVSKNPSPTTVDSPFDVVRRFGYRLDTVAKWDLTTWASFQAEAKLCTALQKQSNDLYILFKIELAHKMPSPEFFGINDRLRRPILNYAQIAAQSNVAASTKKDARDKYFRALIFECGFDLNNVHPETFSDYHAKKLQIQMEERARLKKAFQELSAGKVALDHVWNP